MWWAESEIKMGEMQSAKMVIIFYTDLFKNRNFSFCKQNENAHSQVMNSKGTITHGSINYGVDKTF